MAIHRYSHKNIDLQCASVVRVAASVDYNGRVLLQQPNYAMSGPGFSTVRKSIPILHPLQDTLKDTMTESV